MGDLSTGLPIEEILKIPVSECSCEHCRDCCKNSRPCWGTPADIKNIIEKGHASRLMLDYYEDIIDDKHVYIEIITPALKGFQTKMAPFWPIGRCTFLNEKELCEIHSIKPLEGKVSDHEDHVHDGSVHFGILNTWNTDEGRELVETWKKMMNWDA